MPHPKVTLFLTTYNWPEALHLCLLSITRQTHLPDEVIVADDGSGEATKNVIDNFSETAPFSIVHCWQEDKGYRINAIRNKAISKAQHPYIIQIDGDIILDDHFVADHLAFARPKQLVIGRRVQINEADTLKFCSEGSYHPIHSFRNKFIAILHHLVLYNSTNIKGVRGCNMSYWKEDAININGFDADWIGKGPDDKDFASRLIHSGVRAYNLKFFAVAHHLFHGDEGLRNNYGENQERYKATLMNKKTKCQNGLNQLV